MMKMQIVCNKEGFVAEVKKEQILDNFINVLLFIIAVYLLFSVFNSFENFEIFPFQVFSTVFISILMQALPFMLVGAFLSSIMNIFIPDEFIVKIFPEKHGLGFITALFAGLLFPVCECAIVPVMTGLVKKGVSLPIAITFMLAAPIINPIVIISTLYAFPGRPEIAFYRVIFGLGIAIMIGIFLMIDGKSYDVFLDEKKHDNYHEHGECGHGCCHCNDFKKENLSMGKRIEELFLHTGEEFFNVGKYLIIGAFITSIVQVVLPKSVFLKLGGEVGTSLFIMMMTAFIFSSCSTSDAFIARSFSNKFSMGAVMGFLVFGPMMDIKNILMLSENFKKAFILKLLILITVFNFIVLYFFAFIF